MKKRILVLLLLLLVTPVLAFSDNFQDPDTVDSYLTYYSYGGNLSRTWAFTNEGNGHVIIRNAPTVSSNGYGFINTNPSITDYFAVTYYWSFVDGNPNSFKTNIVLLDPSGIPLYTYSGSTPSYLSGRWEMEMKGMQAYIYFDGVNVATSGVLTQNPTYVNFKITYAVSSTVKSTIVIDDIVYGETDKHVIDAPMENTTLTRDFLNPASTGFYFWNPTTSTWSLMNSFYFYITASGSVTDTPAEETLYIKRLTDHVTVNTTQHIMTEEGATPAHTIQYNITQFFSNPYVTDGYYYAVFADGPTKYSNSFLVQSSGGFVSFDKTSYTIGESGTFSWYLSATYIDLADYTYTYEFQDIYGNVKTSGVTATTPTDTSGTVAVSFPDASYDQGVIYAYMIATNKLTGTRSILGSTAITLLDYVSFQGTCYDALNATPLVSCLVNFTQSGVSQTTTTSTNGNYSVTGLITGATVTVNASKTNYQPYEYSFSPLYARNISLNFAIVPLITNATGAGMGGVARETVYGRLIPTAVISVDNTTSGEHYTRTTNSVGYYQCSLKELCQLTLTRPYSVWGSKTGYGDSANYSVVVNQA